MFLSRHLLYCVACYCALLVRVALRLTDSPTRFARRCRPARFSTHDPLQSFLRGQSNIVEPERMGFRERCRAPRVLLCVMHWRTGSGPAGGGTGLVLWEPLEKTTRRFLSQSCCLFGRHVKHENPSVYTTPDEKAFDFGGKKIANKAATPSPK